MREDDAEHVLRAATFRAVVNHPPFCSCAIWQRETDFNSSRYLCFRNIERVVISCWSAGNPYLTNKFRDVHVLVRVYSQDDQGLAPSR